MDIADFLPEVSLEATGCPEAVMLNALRNSIRELCSRSAVWVEGLADIALLADKAEYLLTEPTGANVVRAEKVVYDGAPVAIKTERQMDEEVAGWKSETGSGLDGVVSISRLTIRAYPIPSKDDTNLLTVRAVLQPTITATTCHDDLGNYSEAIAAGALARLKAIVNKPWTDREAVNAYRAIFENAVVDARDAAWFGFQADHDMRVIPE